MSTTKSPEEIMDYSNLLEIRNIFTQKFGDNFHHILSLRAKNNFIDCKILTINNKNTIKFN